MKVLVAGGTGFVGKVLIKQLLADSFQVVILTRNKEQWKSYFNNQVDIVEWKPSHKLPDLPILKNIDFVINLAGESIGSGRWTNGKKERILASRIDTTNGIVQAIREGVIVPKALINASAVGYYGPHRDELITERDRNGKDFLANVSQAWEEEANKAKELGTRVVTLRIGVVLGQEGALQQMKLPFTFFMGGTIGNGEQWFSWIHIYDLVQMIIFALTNEDIQGPINATSPNPVKMKDFHQILGHVLKRPSWLPVPSFLLRVILGEMADMLVQGQRVIPKKIVDDGYEFTFHTVDEALGDLL